MDGEHFSMHLRLLAPLAVLAISGAGAAALDAFDAEPVGEVVARAAALNHLGVEALLVPTTITRTTMEVGGRLVDTYQVEVFAAVPATAASVTVDAATGHVVEVRGLV